MYQNDRGDFGRYWPIRAARLVSVVMSVLATFFIYRAGREATGQPATGLLVVSLVALLPQFSFPGSQISNDALVTTMGA